MTDRRSGAVRGEPRRFVRGHAARVRPRREFADLAPEKFWASVRTYERTGCWLAPRIQFSLGGQRVYAFRMAILLARGLPVTAGRLAGIRVSRRCRRSRHCVRPDHQVLRDTGNERRAEAINAIRTRMALRAARAS